MAGIITQPPIIVKLVLRRIQYNQSLGNNGVFTGLSPEDVDRNLRSQLDTEVLTWFSCWPTFQVLGQLTASGMQRANIVGLSMPVLDGLTPGTYCAQGDTVRCEAPLTVLNRQQQTSSPLFRRLTCLLHPDMLFENLRIRDQRVVRRKL
jgi:hypothetical protein